jgi:hypothetical protein
MTPWVITLSAVAANGNLTQLYPGSCTAGSGATTMGTLVRTPCEGVLVNCQVEPDGTNGGEIQLWDINGADAGADVNTLAAITDVQLLAMIAAGKARQIYGQKFSGSSGSRLAIAYGVTIMHGIAARYINSVGTLDLNLVVGGCCRKTELCG